jgi:hypothetical protein
MGGNLRKCLSDYQIGRIKSGEKRFEIVQSGANRLLHSLREFWGELIVRRIGGTGRKRSVPFSHKVAHNKINYLIEGFRELG